MARKKIIRTSDFPYHITTRCNNREWFDLPIKDVWQMSLDALLYANSNKKVEIEAFVLMSNHYHLVLHTPDENIDEFMRFFNWRLSKSIREKSQRINHIFGSRYKWSIVDSDRYYFFLIRYVFQNPLRINLVSNCEDYPFSTLHYQTNSRRLPFELRNNWSSPENLNFINEIEDTAISKVISDSLKRNGYFKIKPDRTTRKTIF
jgi:putative transposase